MKVKFEFPKKIKQFVKEEKIKIKGIKDKILPSIDRDLLNKNYQPIKYKEILVVVNGIQKSKNKVFVSPKEISKKKPVKTISSIGHKYSIHYLIFKEK